MAAYAVCVRLNSKILYVLYWGEDEIYRKFSPFFLCGDYRDMEEKRIRIFRCGYFSLNGVIDTGLMDFKRRLGFVNCEKMVVWKKCGTWIVI